MGCPIGGREFEDLQRDGNGDDEDAEDASDDVEKDRVDPAKEDDPNRVQDGVRSVMEADLPAPGMPQDLEGVEQSYSVGDADDRDHEDDGQSDLENRGPYPKEDNPEKVEDFIASANLFRFLLFCHIIAFHEFFEFSSPFYALFSKGQRGDVFLRLRIHQNDAFFLD